MNNKTYLPPLMRFYFWVFKVLRLNFLLALRPKYEEYFKREREEEQYV